MKPTTFGNIPAEDLPREKLIKNGKSALSNSELLAILLSTGIKGKNVLELSAELIKEAGSLDRLAKMEVQELTSVMKGIGTAKATTLCAAFEIGSRGIKEFFEREIFDSPELVYDYMINDVRWRDQETISVLLLDAKCKLIRKVDISSGTQTEAIAKPSEILRPAILYNACSFILTHNHPSGNPTPSAADDKMTERIQAASKACGIRFNDHIIIGKPTEQIEKNYYSYRVRTKLLN